MDDEAVMIVVKRVHDRGDMAHEDAILTEMDSDDRDALEARLEKLTLNSRLRRLQQRWDWTGEPSKWTFSKPWWVPYR